MDGLAPVRVRDPDHRGLRHLRVAGEHVLDLAGVDVEAAGDDHVIAAVLEVDVAVGVHHAHVAGADPPVPELLRRGLRVADVLGERERRLHRDLAELAERQLRTGVVGDLDEGEERRVAARGEEVRARGVVVELGQAGAELRRLGLAEQLDEHLTEDPQAVLQAGGRHRGGAVDDRAQAQIGELVEGVDDVEHPIDHRRDHEGPGDALLDEEIDDALGVEGREDAHGGAAADPGEREGAGGVGERGHDEHLLADGDVRLDHLDVERGGRRAAGVGDRLGPTGGAAGEVELGSDVRVGRDLAGPRGVVGSRDLGEGDRAGDRAAGRIGELDDPRAAGGGGAGEGLGGGCGAGGRVGCGGRGGGAGGVLGAGAEALGERAAELVVGDDDGGAGELELVEHGVERGHVVRRGLHRAEPGDGGVEDDPFGAVARVHRDDVTGADAELAEQIDRGVRPGPDVAIGELAVVLADGGAGGVDPERVLVDLGGRGEHGASKRLCSAVTGGACGGAGARG